MTYLQMKIFHKTGNVLISVSIELTLWSCGSSGSIVSDYELDDRGSIPDRGRGFFFQLLHPDWL
jgi:hypothetical protein